MTPKSPIDDDRATVNCNQKMPLVVIIDSADTEVERAVCLQHLTSAGFDASTVTFAGLNCRTQDEVVSHEDIPKADVVIMWHTLQADKALLARMVNAKAIVRVGVGKVCPA